MTIFGRSEGDRVVSSQGVACGKGGAALLCEWLGGTTVSPAPSDSGVAGLLEEVAAALPGGGEHRPDSWRWSSGSATAIDEGRHLKVQAGTGTGSPSPIGSLRSSQAGAVVVATATKALQDQLANKDLPFLSAQTGVRRGFTFSVLKGRSNYLCRQRAAEVSGKSPNPQMFDEVAAGDQQESSGEGRIDLGRFGAEVRCILDWSEHTASGDRAELDFEPHPRAWAALSVGARRVPGGLPLPVRTCVLRRAGTRSRCGLGCGGGEHTPRRNARCKWWSGATGP